MSRNISFSSCTPKVGQKKMQFLRLSETTSIRAIFIWESPSSPNKGIIGLR